MRKVTSNQKILVVDNSAGITGAFKSILAFAKTLRKDFDFHFAIQKGSLVQDVLRQEDIPFVEIPFLELRRSWSLLLYFPRLLMNVRRLQRYCRQQEIDVVHFNDLYNMVGVAMKMIKPRSKVVYHVRLLPTSYAARIYFTWRTLIHRYADELIVVSSAVGDAIRKRGSPAVTTLIYDFIPITPQHGAIPPSGHFLYPGNYIKGKGQDLALASFYRLIKLNPDCTLRFAGSDLGLDKNRLFRKELEEKALEMGIQEKVSFQGWVADIEWLMKSSRVVLNFSESESFSLVCYEAMVYGCPVISSDCGGPSELIADKVTGVLVPNRDVASMTLAMANLMNNELLRLSLGERAAISIQSKIVEHDAAGRLKSVYDRLLQKQQVTSQ